MTAGQHYVITVHDICHLPVTGCEVLAGEGEEGFSIFHLL